jgi:hypothetical protein
MLPLLPFIAGLAVGAVAISALRSERTKSALNETGSRLRKAANAAEDKVRAATQSGLAMLHRSSAPTDEAPATKPAPEKKPPRKPAAAKTAAKPTASKSGDKPVAKRVSRKPKTTVKSEEGSTT